MKRFWLVLLSLGLIVAFSTSAMAVDLKFSGEYYAAGMYLDKTSLNKKPYSYGTPATYVPANLSTAFYYQRLRLNTTFIVHPGLMLITRADIMERAWGAARSATGTGLDTLSAGTRAENENIAFDLAYAMYVSPIGIFLAGYQIDGAWGTVFGDNSLPTGKVGYMFRGGPVTLGLQTGKSLENSRTAILAATAADRDTSFLTAYGIFAWKTGQAGILGKYIRTAGNRNVIGSLAPATPWYETGVAVNTYVILPYVKAQLGPVAIQAELNYLFGKQKWEGLPATIPAALGGPKKDIDMSQLSFWIDALGDFGMFYAGGTVAYISGDDPSSTDKAEGGSLSGGLDWNPCLIMFNADRTYWAGDLRGYNASTINGPMSNAWFFQVRGGVRPIDKLDIGLSVSYANQDKKYNVNSLYHDYGYEVDLTATYKITNNLSYMLGGGYLFAGKYFLGYSDTNEKQNDFLVINKLTLTF